MSNASESLLFFYKGNKLITVIQGDQPRAIFRNGEIPLAELTIDDTDSSSLLAIDDKGTVHVAHGIGQQPQKSPSN